MPAEEAPFESSILETSEDLGEVEEEEYVPKAVWEVSAQGNVDELKLYIQHGQDINAPNPVTLDSPLNIAVKAKRNDMMSLLLSVGADLNIPNRVGDTPLHWAAYHGDKDMVLALLSKGAKIDVQGDYGNTPLHLACTEGHVEVVSVLLQEGASVTAKNVFGNNALLLSKSPEIEKMVKSVMVDEVAREALKISEREKSESKRQEEEIKRQQEQAMEAQRREQEVKDKAKREAILAEEVASLIS